MTPPRAGSARKSRTVSRLAAVQALYALSVADTALDPLLADVADRTWASPESGKGMARPDEVFLRTLVEGVLDRRDELDRAIEASLSGGWTLARLELLLQAILRCGAWELVAQRETPTGVVINEYIDIGHAFFAGKEPSLVNAVLDRLAARWRRDEAAPTGRAPARNGDDDDGGGDGGGD